MQASNEKRRVRFNIIDVLLILIVLALIVSTVIRSRTPSDLQSEDQTVSVEVKFLIQNMSTELFNSVVIGETVMTRDGKLLGTLKSADFRKAEMYYIGDDGVPVLTESDTYYDVRCMLTAEGVNSDKGFLLGGESYLAPGQYLSIKTPSLAVQILITDIIVMQ